MSPSPMKSPPPPVAHHRAPPAPPTGSDRARAGAARTKGKPIEVSVYDYGWHHARLTRQQARVLAMHLLELAEGDA